MRSTPHIFPVEAPARQRNTGPTVPLPAVSRPWNTPSTSTFNLYVALVLLWYRIIIYKQSTGNSEGQAESYGKTMNSGAVILKIVQKALSARSLANKELSLGQCVCYHRRGVLCRPPDVLHKFYYVIIIYCNAVNGMDCPAVPQCAAQNPSLGRRGCLLQVLGTRLGRVCSSEHEYRHAGRGSFGALHCSSDTVPSPSVRVAPAGR